jgi:hypothetical protein
MNHWFKKWIAGTKDITQKSFFIGWWSGDKNRIVRKDPRFAQYGRYPATPEEQHKIEQVRILYDHRVTQEQLAWHRWKQVQAGSEQDLLDQNQPWTAEDAFVETGYSFFQAVTVGRDIRAIEEANPPITYKGYRYNVDGDFYSFSLIPLDPKIDAKEDVELKVWEEPKPEGRYAIGFDPAHGRNEHKDGHAIVVLRCYADCVVQVAEYRTSEPEVKYAAWVAFHLCGAYRDCVINVEITGPGMLAMTEFKHLREFIQAEHNLPKTEARDWTEAADQARWFLHHREDSFGTGYNANYKATSEYKERMLYGLRGAYMAREIKIKSKKLLEEMLNVVVVEGDFKPRIGAVDSKKEDEKDDRVFALGLALLSWTHGRRSEMLAAGLTYDVVVKQESDNNTPSEKKINTLVQRFLARAEEEVLPEPSWMERYGLE